MRIVNLAFYRFVDLADPLALRGELRALTAELGLKGTILLAREGINGFIAGTPESILAFRAALEKWPELRALDFKESPSSEKPFHRMLVKIKREIIPMGR